MRRGSRSSDNGFSHGDVAVHGVSADPLSDEVFIAVTVVPVVDAVAIWASEQYLGDEDVALALVVNISSADPDAVKSDLAVVLMAGHGNLLTTTRQHALRFHGNWSECADALAQLVYTPDAD